jgi:small multidrug resistance family-3 protein
LANAHFLIIRLLFHLSRKKKRPLKPGDLPSLSNEIIAFERFTAPVGHGTGIALIKFQSYQGGLTMTSVSWLVFIAAAVLEVGGDAVIRKGLRGSGLIIIMIGFVMLGCYGVVVNTVRWDFARLLGVYVAVFALVSVLFGRFVFRENIPAATWAGLCVIMCGGLIIQFGELM